MQPKTRMLVTPITLLVLLGVLAFGAWWGFQLISAPLPGNEPTPCVTKSVEEVAVDQIAVRVYNGGYTTGLGSKVGTALTKLGFTVLDTANTEERITTTVIVASSEDAPEAQLVLSFFKDATIKADGRTDAIVDVMVGSDWGGMNKKADKSITVESGSACLPVLPSASTSPSASSSPS